MKIATTFKSEFFLLVMIFLIAFSVRCYRLDQYLFFGFEQGRDAELVRQIIKLEDLVLVGPKTDIAGIFHGAWFYYFLTIPYLLGQGHPLAASLMLAITSALVPVGFYILTKQVFKQKNVAFYTALISTFSFDLITYSRWLSNVSWVIPLVFLFIVCAWLYHHTAKSSYFIYSVLAFALAAQFQIMLSLWMLVVFGMLLLSKSITLPQPKTILASILLAGMLYTPLLLFNLKHDFISLRAAYEYITESSAAPLSLLATSFGYSEQLQKLFVRTLGGTETFFQVVFVMTWFIGLILCATLKQFRTYLWLCIGLSTMTLPVMAFGKSLNLEQLYVGSSLGLLGLSAISFYGWSQHRYKWVGLSILLIGALIQLQGTFTKVRLNQGFYFITIQEGLEFRHQKEIMSYILSQQPAGSQYFLKALTIPYYQEQGWQYLRSYYLDKVQFDAGAKTIYVVIEPQVDPYWQQQWIKDLGSTVLIEERLFGQIKVLKLERTS